MRALGKYPFHFDQITVFPLAGLEYSLNLNDLFVDLGAGVDYPLNDKWYIRGEGLFGLNLTAKPEATTVDSASGYTVNIVASVGYKF